MKNYDIEEENDFDYDEFEEKEEFKCFLCSEIFNKNELKVIGGVLICEECEVSTENLEEFKTIENCVNWYKKKGYK